MNGTPTEVVYAQDANKDTNEVADARDNLDDYREGVEEGDYLAVVYRTPSNAGSLQRVMGTVEEVEDYDSGNGFVVRFPVEDGTGDGPTGDEDATAALFLNDEDAYRFDDGRTDTPAGGFGVEKWAWTPADETTVEA
mgnify:CR=1 FL=1